jgi:hypothetical protein
LLILFKQPSRMPVPSAPQIKTQPRAKSTTLEYVWNPPTSNGGSPITGYLLELSGSADFSGIAYSDGPGPNTFYYKVPGLTNGLTYYTRLSASNDGGTTYGPFAYFRPFQPGNKPTAPGSATANVVGNSSAIIEWTPGTTPDATIFWYAIISQSSDPLETPKRITANGLTQSNYLVTGLNSANTYTFAVYSVNCPGYSAATVTNSISFTPPFGSAYFDNTTSSTSFFNLSPGIVVGTSEFTVECFFYIPAYPVSFQLTSGAANCLNISLTTAGDIEVTLQGVSSLVFTAPATLTNKWTHLAIARKIGQTAVWFDGVQTSEGPIADTKDYSGSIIQIGGANIIGYLTNMRFVVGSSLYDPTNSFFFTPTGPLTVVTNTQLLMLESSSGNLLTDSSSTQTITNDGEQPVIWSSLSPFFGPGTAVPFYSSLGNYLSASPGITVGSSDFSLEFFFNIYAGFASFNIISSSLSDGIRVWITTSNTLIVSLNDNSGALTYTLPTITTNRWYYVVVSRSGTDEAVWINGIRTIDGIQTDTNVYSDSSEFIALVDDNYITNVKFEVGSSLFPPSNSYISIPPIPLSTTDQTNLLLLTTTAETLTTDTSSQQIITNVNNVSWTYLSPFGGPGSAQFDSAFFSNLTLSPGISNILAINSAFTVEFFIWFPVAPSAEMYIIGGLTKGANISYLQISLGNGFINVSQEGGNVYTYTEPSYTAGQWYHIAIVNNDGSEAVWVNGTQTTEGIQTDTNTYTGDTTTIGLTQGTISLTATITNLRVKDTAVYNVNNSTITVPTTVLNPAGSLLCLQTATATTLSTDASGTQNITNIGVYWCYLTPFGPQ